MKIRVPLIVGALVLLISGGWVLANNLAPTTLHFGDHDVVADQLTPITSAAGYSFGRCVIQCASSPKILHVVGYWDMDNSGTFTRADTITMVRDRRFISRR